VPSLNEQESHPHPPAPGQHHAGAEGKDWFSVNGLQSLNVSQETEVRNRVAYTRILPTATVAINTQESASSPRRKRKHPKSTPKTAIENVDEPVKSVSHVEGQHRAVDIDNDESLDRLVENSAIEGVSILDYDTSAESIDAMRDLFAELTSTEEVHARQPVPVSFLAQAPWNNKCPDCFFIIKSGLRLRVGISDQYHCCRTCGAALNETCQEKEELELRRLGFLDHLRSVVQRIKSSRAANRASVSSVRVAT
jgi:hypothetical protein